MTYRVTKEKYQQGLKKGWNDEDMLRPATYQVRRARHLNAKAVQKQKVTINLDSDILEFYKERAAQPGNPPYQTQINNELRRAIEASPHTATARGARRRTEGVSSNGDSPRIAALAVDADLQFQRVACLQVKSVP